MYHLKMNKTLRDNNGRIIGYVKTEGNVSRVEDVNGKKLGKYDSSTDELDDVSGKRLGFGESSIGSLFENL